MIKQSDVTLSELMEVKDSEELYFQIQDVVHQQAQEKIRKGVLIRRSQVKESPAPEAVKPKKQVLHIPKGMRALSVSKNDIAGIPDLLEIGSYVDVIGLSERVDGRTEMKTILYGRQVLFVDATDGSNITSLTLAVYPDEAEHMVTATSLGKIRLVIRPDAGEYATFEAPSGVMEIIRGVGKERKVAAEL